MTAHDTATLRLMRGSLPSTGRHRTAVATAMTAVTDGDMVDGPHAGRTRMRAAWAVYQAGRAEVADAACAMRARGASWDDVACELEFARIEDEPHPPNEIIYEWVAAERMLIPHQAPVVVWTCATCQGRVQDFGPYDGHPVDCEHGHAEDCERHAEDIRRYTAWLDTPAEDTPDPIT